MKLDEVELHEPCADCGTVLAEGLSPLYGVNHSTVLCLSCAVRRGGEYDAKRDKWTRPPDLTGLVRKGQEPTPP